MRVHEIDVTNLVPVKPFECFMVSLEKKGNNYVLKTVVGDLVELEKYEKRHKEKKNEMQAAF